MESPRIAVVGSGLTGLAAAHRLGELAAKQQFPCRVTLLEARAESGGLVGTVEQAGYLIDTGADSFITNKPGALQLCQRLGLEDRLQATDPRYRGALVLSRGRPYPVPEGFQLLSPSALWPVMLSPILSPWGKFRLLMEYFIPPRREDLGDESLASFVRRRLGKETLDRLVQPLVGGIYTSDPEQLSLNATLPRFLEMERHSGGLIRAARRARAEQPAEDRSSGGARYGLFAGLQGGMGELVQTLTDKVRHTSEVRYEAPVTSITRNADPATHADQRYLLQIGATEPVEFDAVILALPTYRTAELVSGFDRSLADALQAIDYASSAIVVSGHKLSDIRHPLNSFGLVIPHRERRKILAVSFSSRKFPNRAPEGRVLLRTFVGGALQPELLDQDDAALVQMVRDELRLTLGVNGEPDFTQVVRYPRAMPQYTLGHLDRVATVSGLAATYSRLAIAGNAFFGVGVPDAIASGEQAAEEIFGLLSASSELIEKPINSR